MKQRSYLSLLLAGVITLSACMISACKEDIPAGMTSKPITFVIDDNGFDEGAVSTRGTKVTSISSFGVSASVYSAASTYASAGCGSYFFNETATVNSPINYFWPTSAYKLSFFTYYPYGSSAFTLQSNASATGAPTYSYTVPSDVTNQMDIMTGQNVNITGGATSPVSISMKHRCAAICFSVTNSRSTAITLNSVSIEGVKYTGTLREDTWTLGAAVNSSSSNPFVLSFGSSLDTHTTAYTTKVFLMLPQTIPAGAKVKVVIDGEDPLYADLTGSWVAGRQYNYNLDVQKKLIIVDEDSEIEDWDYSINLSMVDNAGNNRLSMTTANCYLVHAAGDYKIPLVYGNAIKDGEVNTVAFFPDKIVDGTKHFTNHNGEKITGPWITKSTSGLGTEKGMGLAATSAELLWQDVEGLVSAVSVFGDYLRFTVGTFNPGNALIAVKDGSGTILWSWHIWATDETLASTTAVDTGSQTYNVAVVNLGWVPTGGDGKQGYCPYYQWGRKDPFIPAAAYNSSSDHTVYNISNTPTTGITYTASTTATIADNIMNPTTLYYNSGTHGPAVTTFTNMWNGPNLSTATKKTVYDPCPPGFCVPTGNLYSYITDGDNFINIFSDTNNKGITTEVGITGDALWFPAAGCRSRFTGMPPTSVGLNGYYWSATAAGASGGTLLFFDIDTGFFQSYEGNLRSNAYPVRPVTENGLPVGYTLLEYIENQGDSWIDTGCTLDFSETIKIKMSVSNYQGKYGGIFGNYSNEASNCTRIIQNNGNPLKALVYFNNKAGGGSKSCDINGLNQINTFEISADDITVNGSSIGAPSSVTGTAYNASIKLFRYTTTSVYGKLYEFSISGKRNMVPVKSPENIVGMYDTINDVFYSSETSTPFIAGPEKN